MRRIVTANNEKGKSYVKWDAVIKPVPGRKGFSFFPMWATKQLPVENTEEDPITWEIGTSIGGGSVFRIIRFEPNVAPRFHRTDTVDYSIVLSGEIDMVLDEQVVHLKAGDIVVQRGTLHNWQNNGTEPCLMLFVLIATQGGKSTGW